VLTIGKVHDYAKFSILGLEYLNELDNVGMGEHLEYLGFLDRLLPLIVTHLADIDLLHHTF